MKSYDIHKDLRFLKPLKMSKYTPFRLKFANMVLKIMAFLTLPHRQVKAKRMTFIGHKLGKVKLTYFKHKDINDPVRGVVVCYHGGGFQLLGTPIHIRLASDIVMKTRYAVYYIDYRLAPKYPFPYALEDSYQGLLFAYAHAKNNHPKLSDFVVYGDSAGGNLAAAMTLLSRDRQGPKITKQLLIYPVISHKQDVSSIKTFTDTPIWNSKLNFSMWQTLLRDGDFGMLQYVSLLEADLKNLPPCHLETAEFDPLRDHGIMYANKLIDANVMVHSYHTYQTVHGYDGVFFSPFVKQMVERRIDFILNGAVKYEKD